MGKMSDEDFRQIVKRLRDAALEHLDGPRKADRLTALQFYRGDDLTLYGNGGDGLSTVVSRDFMESVEAVLPGLIKPFIAGDETVRFEPKEADDEEGAKQATEYINYLFQNHNEAPRVVYDFAKDGMMFRLGVAKVVHETVIDKTMEAYDGLDEMMLQAIEADKDHEIVGDIMLDEQTGLYDVKCSKSVERSTFRVYVISEDEFMFEPRLANPEEGRFFGHRATKPKGDFIAMGLPKAKVMALKSDASDTQDDDDRFKGEDDRDGGTDDADLARLVTLDECYVRCDRDGTGVLGWRKAFISAEGDQILMDEEADDHPYEMWTPIPLPHKLVGMSYYDITRDIQVQKTALVRETMNALYLNNRPMREVLDGKVNIEDLLNPSIGGLIRVKEMGAVREVASGGSGVIQSSLAMIEHLDGVREQRTGSTRYNQGMDADSLNKTASGMAMIQNASQQRQELVARHLAEGIKGIFKKMLGLTIRHQDKAQVIRLRGKWVEMNPKDWKAGYDMSVAVGLGTGNREQQIGQLQELLMLDEKIIALQQGTNGPILTDANIYEKLKRLVEAMGLKGIENYYTDPAAQDEQPEQPEQPEADPMAEAQMQAEADLAKARLKADTDIEIARIKAEASIIIAGMGVGMVPEPQQMDMEAAEPSPQPQEQLEAPMEPEMMPMPPEQPYMGDELYGDMA